MQYSQSVALESCHQSPIAENTHAIRYRHYFIKVMRDEQHRTTLVTQTTQQLQEFAGLMFAKDRGWLIKNQHLRFTGKTLGNFHILTIGNGEFTHCAVKVHLCAEHGQQCPGALALLRAIHSDSCQKCRFTSQQHILSNAQCCNKIEFLMHHGDARANRGARTAQRGWLAVAE